MPMLTAPMAAPTGTVERRIARLPQVARCDGALQQWRHAGRGRLQGGCLRRDAHGVEHGQRPGRCRCGAQRLGVILGGDRCRRQADDRRDHRAGGAPHHRADGGVGDRIGEQAIGDPFEAEDRARGPPFIQVQAGRRRASGDGAADVDEVAVAVGAGAQHRVREHDRVRLGPGDVFTEGRSRGELVGRARPRGAAAHRHVGLHQGAGVRAGGRRPGARARGGAGRAKRR